MSNVCPETEYSQQFLDGMLNRMLVSFHKYGPVKKSTADSIANVKERLRKYDSTGNTEFLMDASNFCMMEFMNPIHPDAHFKATDDKDSPGLVFEGSSRPRRGVNNQGERIG